MTSGHLDHARYIEVANNSLIVSVQVGRDHVTGELSASRNGWSGLLYTGGKPYFSRRYEIDIVDRVGGGDAFAAGLIYSMCTSKPPQGVDRVRRRRELPQKLIMGDFNVVRLEEVNALWPGTRAGRAAIASRHRARRGDA